MTAIRIDRLFVPTRLPQPEGGNSINVITVHVDGVPHLLSTPPYRLAVSISAPGKSFPDLKIGTVWEATVSFAQITSPLEEDESAYAYRLLEFKSVTDKNAESSLSDELAIAPRSDRAGGYRSENIGRPVSLEGGEDKTLRIPIDILAYMKDLTHVNSRALRWMLDAVPEPTAEIVTELIAEVDTPDPDDKRVLMADAKRTTVYIDSERLRKLEGWGDENVSRGVRIIYAYIEDHPEIQRSLSERSVQAASDRRSNNDVLDAYVKALHAYNGERTTGYDVRYNRGWYQVVDKSGLTVGSYRRSDIVEMTEQLLKLLDAEPLTTEG